MKKLLFTLLAAGTMCEAFAQLPVSTVAQNKHIVLEQYGGIQSVFDADGHTVANSIYANNPGTVLINIHTGGFSNAAVGQPDFQTTIGDAIAAIPGMGITGYPAGDINRTILTGTVMAAGRQDWTNMGNTIVSQSAYCNVAVQGKVNAATRVLTYTAQVYYTANSPATTNSLTVVLLEDKVLGPQLNFGNPLYNASNYNADGSYNHNHVLRSGLSAGNFGITIPITTAGTSFSTTGTYTIPATYGVLGKTTPCLLGNIKLAAFVTQTNTLTINGANGPIAITNIANAIDGGLSSLKADDELCAGNLQPSTFIFTNNGSTAITSAVINYSVTGGALQTYNFIGNLAPFTQTVITLPSFAFTPTTLNTLNVSIAAVNGASDLVTANNLVTASIPLTTKIANYTNMSMIFTQDQYGSESTWVVTDEVSGAILASGGPYNDLAANGTLVQPAVNFTVVPNTCYKVVVNDAYGDGFNSGYGAGNYVIKSGVVNLYTMNGIMAIQDLKLFKTNANAINYIDVSTTQQEVTCNGYNNGSASVIANGGTPPYTYSWNTSPPQNTQTINGLALGTYTCVVTDAAANSATTSVTIQSQIPFITSTNSITISTGSSVNLALTANVPSTFTWLAANNSNVSGESITNQTLTTISNTLTNTSNIPQTVTYTVIPTAISGTCTGTPQILSVTVYPISGQNCSEIFISEYVEGSANNKAMEFYNPTAASISMNNYRLVRYANGSVTVTDSTDLVGTIYSYSTFVIANGVGVTTGTTATFPACSPALQALAQQLDGAFPSPTFFNGDDAVVLVRKSPYARIDIFGKIGELPVTAWSDAAPYDGTVGKWWTKDHSLQRKAAIKKGVLTNPLQFNVTLEWDSLPNNNFSNLGIHACSCASTVVPITLTTSQQNVTCNGYNNGVAWVNINSGTAPYTYSWSVSPAQTTQTVTGLAAGTYSCFVSDATGQTVTTTLTITQPAALSNFNSTIITNGSCNGNLIGSAQVNTPVGGTPPYTYLWSTSPAQTTQTVTGLASGIYTISVSDSNNCVSQSTVAINPLNQFNVNFTANQTLFIAPPFVAQFTNTTPNASNYNFVWDFGDGTILSSNNASVFHQYQYNGLYTVKLIATAISTSCQDTLIKTDYIFCTGGVTCNLTASITPATNTNACAGDSTLLTCTNSGNITYQWYLNGTAINGAVASTYYAAQSGNYQVAVTNSVCTDFSNQVTLTFNAPPQAPVIASTGNLTQCLGGSVVLNASSGYSSYLWSTGSTSQSISVTGSGIYSVIGKNTFGCGTRSQPYLLNFSAAPTTPICLVTVDTTSLYNQVIWDKPATTAIDSFKIYRETMTNVFSYINSVAYDSLSIYNDFAANPNVTSYKYKISAIDTCGNETLLSNYHNTIHLQYLGGGNLQWTVYSIENELNPVLYYMVFRDDNSSGNFLPISSTIPGGNSSFTDISFSSYPNAAYRVDVVWNRTCVPAKLTSTSTSISRSNVKDVQAPTNLGQVDLSKFVSIYPNPASTSINVRINTTFIDNAMIELYDATGKLIMQQKVVNEYSALNLNGLANGIYSVRVITDNEQTIKRIVKQQ